MKRLERINQSAAGSYSIVSGRGILEDECERLWSERNYHRSFLVVDENVMNHHRERIEALMELTHPISEPWIVPSGETSKSLEFWRQGLDTMLKHKITRRTPVIAVGGGVPGDLAGFMAASVLRGVPLIHLPTTLLAMVDSSIGGKTGVNHPEGKNLVGAFHTPDAVIQDLEFLMSLPAREWANGLSEGLKSGLIADMNLVYEAKRLFCVDGERPVSISDLTPSTLPVVQNPDALQQWIFRCASIKCDITSEDEFENGRRAYLNFGHTLGHALEKMCNFEVLHHGEAVFLGMMAALYLSNQLYGKVTPEILLPFRSLYPLAVSPDGIQDQTLMKYLKSDKKRDGETVRFVLLKDWEKPCLQPVDPTLVSKAIDVIRRTL